MAMNLGKVLILISAVICLSSGAKAQDVEYMHIANEFLMLMDQKQYDAAWALHVQPAEHKSKLQESYIKQFKQWRQSVGGLEKRELFATDLMVFNLNSPNETKAYSLKYKSAFTKGKEVYEVVTVSNHAGSWKVARYSLSE